MMSTQNTTRKAIKAIVIGRHDLLPGQKELIAKAGLEIAGKIEQLPQTQHEIAKLVSELKAKGIEAIVVQALPINLLAILHQEASKVGIEVLTFRMEAVALVNSEEEARKLVAEKPELRTFLKAPNMEKIRVIECVALEKIRAIKIETEVVATP